MQVLDDELLMQTKEVTETPTDFHLCLPEIWNVRLQTQRASEQSFTVGHQYMQMLEKSITSTNKTTGNNVYTAFHNNHMGSSLPASCTKSRKQTTIYPTTNIFNKNLLVKHSYAVN